MDAQAELLEGRQDTGAQGLGKRLHPDVARADDTVEGTHGRRHIPDTLDAGDDGCNKCVGNTLEVRITNARTFCGNLEDLKRSCTSKADRFNVV